MPFPVNPTTQEVQGLDGAAVAVSAASLPLPAGAATEATLLTRTKPADQQHVIIDSSTPNPLKAREDTAAMTWVSVKSAAPAIGAVQADTGALAAGSYDFDIYLVCSDTVAVGKGLVVEHRNAANGATLFNLGGSAPSSSQTIAIRRYTLAVNERIRVIAGTAAGAAASMYVSAIGYRVS